MPPRIGGLQFAPGSSKPAPRAAPAPVRPAPQKFAQALGLGGQSPFAKPVAQARAREQRTASSLPGKPSLTQVAHGYDRAITATFDHQPAKVKATIVANAIRTRTPDGDTILQHVTGLSGAKLDAYAHTFATDTGFHQSSPFDAVGHVLGAVAKAVKPYSPGQVGRALTDPGFASSAEGFNHPDLVQTSRLQGALSSVSSFLGKQVDKGQQAGVLGSGNRVSAGFDGGKLGINALHDLFNLPAEAIPSVYLPASEAASGHVGTAAQQLAQPYVDLVKHPVKSFTNHPLNSALMVYGPASGVSRGVGAVGRRAGVQAFSTERAPATVPTTAIKELRSYSKDPVVKAVQVTRERSARKVIAGMHKKASELEAQAAANPEHAAALESRAHQIRHEAAQKDPNLLGSHGIAKMMDDLEGVNQGVQAAHRTQVTEPVRAMLKATKPAGHAVSPIAQGIIEPTVDGIRSYRDELARVAKSDVLSPAERSANTALRKGLSSALENAQRGKFDPAEVSRLVQQHYAPLMKQLETKLDAAGILPKGQAERSAQIPFAARKGMRDASSEAIRSRMQEMGIAEPSFVTQAPNKRGPGNFYRNWSNPGTIGRTARTGQATVKGTFDAHPETMVEQVARMQGLVDAHEGFGRFVQQFSFRKNGKTTTFQTKAQAQKIADNLSVQPGSPGWQVVQLSPWKGKTQDVQGIVDGVHPDTNRSVGDILDSAVRGDGDGPFALVPKAAADRMRAHIGVLGAGGGGKLFRLVSGTFRKTVLATSPSWLAGNITEAAARTAINRATPLDARFAAKVFKEMERTNPEAGLAARIQGSPGGLYGFSGKTVRTAADQFKDASPPLAAVARGMGAFWQTPGPKQLAGLWHSYTNFVFNHVNGMLEQPHQLAMAGAHMRRQFGLSHKDMLNSQKAVEQAARGLRDTPEQVAMGRTLRRAYGQYNSWSPAMRRTAALYTPFASWSLNAVKFLYQVLPQDHPVLTALLADANTASEEWRKQHGLDLFMGKKGLPGFLQGSVPTGGGGHFRGFTRYTPFGFATQPLDTVAGLVLPQISGVQAAFQGRDWTGKELRNKDGTPYDQLQLFKHAVQQFAESTIPFAGKAQAFAGAQGNVGQRALHVLNPFAVTKAKAKKGGGSGGGVPGGGGVPSGGGAPTGGGVPTGGGAP